MTPRRPNDFDESLSSMTARDDIKGYQECLHAAQKWRPQLPKPLQPLPGPWAARPHKANMCIAVTWCDWLNQRMSFKHRHDAHGYVFMSQWHTFAVALPMCLSTSRLLAVLIGFDALTYGSLDIWDDVEWQWAWDSCPCDSARGAGVGVQGGSVLSTACLVHRQLLTETAYWSDMNQQITKRQKEHILLAPDDSLNASFYAHPHRVPSLAISRRSLPIIFSSFGLRTEACQGKPPVIALKLMSVYTTIMTIYYQYM